MLACLCPFIENLTHSRVNVKLICLKEFSRGCGVNRKIDESAIHFQHQNKCENCHKKYSDQHGVSVKLFGAPSM